MARLHERGRRRRAAALGKHSGRRLQDSGASSIDVTNGAPRRAPSADAAGRCAASSNAGTASSRFVKNSRNRTEAPSAQCRSSTISSCGRCAASPATSQYRPCSTPNDASASTAGREASGNTTGPASAAAPASARLRADADMPRNRGSNSWRTTPHAYATSRSDPRALRHREACAPAPHRERAQGHARLADPRRSAHHDRASSAPSRLVERIDDDLQLAPSLLQPARHAAESMAATDCAPRPPRPPRPTLRPRASRLPLRARRAASQPRRGSPPPRTTRRRAGRTAASRQRSCLGVPVPRAARCCVGRRPDAHTETPAPPQKPALLCGTSHARIPRC